MFLTEKEIFSQYKALKETYKYMQNKEQDIKIFLEKCKYDSLSFIGSGSSYCLCQSAEISAKIHFGITANSFAAGDIMINFDQYVRLIKNTLLVLPSRSGSTTEVIASAKIAKEKYNVPCISICSKENSELSFIANFSLEVPWAFDESVCQTRTVVNLYMVNLFLISIMANDHIIQKEIESAIGNGNKLISQYHEPLKEFVRDSGWNKVIILADSELYGLAAEGALACKEISQIPSNYYHILDVRHGPMVLIDNTTLVIIACSPYGLLYQKKLIEDLHGEKAIVVTVGDQPSSIMNSDLHVQIPYYEKYGVAGIPFVLVPQIMSYYKAIFKGINPDKPTGLEPYITFKLI